MIPIQLAEPDKYSELFVGSAGRYCPKIHWLKAG